MSLCCISADRYPLNYYAVYPILILAGKGSTTTVATEHFCEIHLIWAYKVFTGKYFIEQTVCRLVLTRTDFSLARFSSLEVDFDHDISIILSRTVTNIHLPKYNILKFYHGVNE